MFHWQRSRGPNSLVGIVSFLVQSVGNLKEYFNLQYHQEGKHAIVKYFQKWFHRFICGTCSVTLGQMS